VQRAPGRLTEIGRLHIRRQVVAILDAGEASTSAPDTQARGWLCDAISTSSVGRTGQEIPPPEAMRT